MPKKKSIKKTISRKVGASKPTGRHSDNLFDLCETQIRAGNSKAAIQTLHKPALEDKRLSAENRRFLKKNADMQASVRQERELFEVLVKNNPMAVVTIDNDARVTVWNPTAEKLFGFSKDEALGRDIDELVANLPELHTEAIAYSKTGLGTDAGAFQVIVKRTRKDGTLVDVELSGVPIIVQNKKLGMYALYHDITELQRSRQEAEQSRDIAQRQKEFSEALVLNSPVAIVSIDIHVLVVDDDPHISDMLSQLLPESDFRLESAFDGEAGLKAVEANRPDVVLLDIMMPILDGFGVIERLRANPSGIKFRALNISRRIF